MYNRKQYQRIASDCENRWKKATQSGNICDAFDAVNDYRRSISTQESELERMDHNTNEYIKAEELLDEQRGACSMIEEQQNRLFLDDNKLGYAYEEYCSRNKVLSREMRTAIDRGETERYDTLRGEYQRNISSQQDIASLMNRHGVDVKDSVLEEKFDIQNHDISMRNKLDEDIELREQRGKTVRPEDHQRADKYARQVNDDTEDLLKYQNDMKMDSMRKRGASAEELQAQEKEGMYEINRFRKSCTR